ncbi:hypothetical protein [Pseudomonas sp. NPDC089569]|uniref:hypothetical protein n=1 Tax=Pseudomonas sp. NPDC089569 TaxID=3390722 RepID=UPI003D002CBA
MNARQTLYIVSHPLRISRYGAHTSLSAAERVEIVDALSDTLGTTLGMLAQFKRGQQKLRNISFLPVQQLFHCLVRANGVYAEFLATVIVDLGGHVETAALYSLHDIHEPQCLADCLAHICRGARRLRALDALLRDCRENAIDHKDNASRRLLDECIRHTARFTSLIEDNLPHEQPW